MMAKSKLEKKARKFAKFHHAIVNQKRKYTGAPYIVHPEAVAKLVKSVPDHTEEMIAAAWLHDTVEDTLAGHEDIKQQFGEVVHDLVKTLTNVNNSEGNRAERNRLNIDKMAKGSREAKTIRLADIIDNCDSIIEHDPKFAIIYLKEKAEMLDVLEDGDPGLYTIARKIIHSTLD